LKFSAQKKLEANSQLEIDLRQFSTGIYTADTICETQHQTKGLIKSE
jgi:hypothetical protein